tara:strand:+ start:445 stop:552 length:108 start_codon:yes stop_codon:yes gene_type:complete
MSPPREENDSEAKGKIMIKVIKMISDFIIIKKDAS